MVSRRFTCLVQGSAEIMQQRSYEVRESLISQVILVGVWKAVKIEFNYCANGGV